MLRYLAKKFVFMVVSILVLATITFFLMKAIPGDPFMSEKEVPESIRQNLYAQYGLDKPLFEQYVTYMKNVFLHFDLGVSMKKKFQTVGGIIEDAFIYSLKLGIVAIIVSVAVGLLLGMIAALKHRKFLDSFTMIVAVLGVSVPSFVLAYIMQYLFGVKWQFLSVAGLDSATDYIMPVIALSAMPIAFIARLTRSTMLEVLSSDYIKTAKSKGLSQKVVMIRHALKNAILPVVTYLGPMTTNIITGSVVIERIFGIPGLGKHFVDSVSNRDYTMIMGMTIFYGIILMIARFLTDVAYGFVDPRIKLTSRKEG
ncbi:ABC transporter permease [Marinicrinis lubricantis]|uniref:ABC transporter permease n=1 Tax=Marinicrinis lubricantis TaxID=2086470 RepID=A0ABW1IV23_9BACL